MNDHGKRILILGTTGAGKTYLGRQLSGALRIPVIELDAMFWGENWTRQPRDVFIGNLRSRIEQDSSWIVDGNFEAARAFLLPSVTDLIWIDYPVILVQLRLVRRTLLRILCRKQLWNGNRETFRLLWNEKFSIFRYSASFQFRLRRELNPLSKSLIDQGVNVWTIRSKGDARRLIEQFSE
jgi:adenylate kinase family enzyme